MYLQKSMHLKVQQGSILNSIADVIVNPANPQLLKGGGLSGIIHQAAGDELFQYLREWKIKNNIPYIDHGSAMISPSFKLPHKKIIHAVGAVWNDGSENEKEILKNCYIASLNLAEEHRFKSISFPNISTGIYGFPKDVAAHIAINTIQSFKAEYLKEVIFTCYDEMNYSLYKSILR